MKTIILIHGIRGTHHGLAIVAKNLSQKYKVITPDLPGSGTRAELKDKTLDGYVEWLHSYIQSLQLKQKPYLIGHSMGSMITSHYLEKYPNEIQQKTVFMSPVFRTKINQKLMGIICGLFVGFLHLLPKTTRCKFIGSKFMSYCISHYLTCDKTQQKTIDQLHYRYSGRFSSAESIVADIKVSMRQYTIIPPHYKILLIIGDKDKLSSLKLAREHAQKRNVKIRVLPNSGHLINYERPQKVADFIADYIK